MHENIASTFAELASSSAPVIVKNILIWEERLAGKLPALKIALGNSGRGIGLDCSERTESQALRTILLSAVVTAYDPYLAGSPLGIAHQSAIKEAAATLNVVEADIKPLSTVEKNLYAVLATAAP
ncbi:hypothetical protein HWE04_02135 [Herbaspirillum sp. C7C2]|uniref:hypothetical protein n=1 Tax=Herbaspirillum sp. C7C2 TaxID=2736666 RepID=UPI001F51A6E5|nr:hypothetical protein [Herbaspirillum sp. C7C2]MCI1012634.1 hypothetical protein [Herbaspirillum sp. C7C2]